MADNASAFEIRVPELGESVLEATVNHWIKQEGEAVSVGEPLVELETDKVNLEVSARQSGRLAHIDRKEGEDVKVGDLLGMLEPVEEGAGQAQPQPSAAAQPAKQPQPEPVSPATGQAAPAELEVETAAPAPTDEERASSQATPVALNLLREQGIDPARIHGSGPGGRITKGDVQAYLEKQKVPQAQTPQAPASKVTVPELQQRAVQPPPAPAPQGSSPAIQTVPPAEDGRHEERVKLSRRRRTIAQRLVEAQHTAAMLTTFNEIDMSAVMAVRERRNEAFQKRYGVKLGYTSFFVKAVIGALKVFPQLNSEIQGDEMILKRYYDIGIAVGAPEGLVVPVLRDADRMTFAMIEQKVKEFVQKSENGSLTLEDLRGGTFTITNGGVFGSLMSTPILTPPQVGILGLHKIERRPIAIGEDIVIRPMMYVALSYDHRIVDGREAVQYLVRVKELIEDPENLLLEG